ncbi:MAG: hypothetical protein GX362_06580 [Methanosarcinaceae archaeon]|nr:hypothetical protein [Methanosarcinaceae archaeon]
MIEKTGGGKILKGAERERKNGCVGVSKKNENECRVFLKKNKTVAGFP